MRYILIICMLGLMPICGISQSSKSMDKKESGTNDRTDINEEIRRFLNQYPAEKYQVKFGDWQASSVDVAELMTLLRSCSWKEEDLQDYGNYCEPYATISIKAKGSRKELLLSVTSNGIDALGWSQNPSISMLDNDGRQKTMYYELIPKINEIMFRTVADFKNIEIIDTLRVVATRSDHTVGGLLESITMNDEDSREYIRLLNHTIFSVVHQG